MLPAIPQLGAFFVVVTVGRSLEQVGQKQINLSVEKMNT